MKVFPIQQSIHISILAPENKENEVTITYAHGKPITQDDLELAWTKFNQQVFTNKSSTYITTHLLITEGTENGRNETVSIKYPLGFVPNQETLSDDIDKISKDLPEGFRVMTRHEAFLYNFEADEVLALPKLPEGQEWHDPETANISIYQSQPWRLDRQDELDDMNY